MFSGRHAIHKTELGKVFIDRNPSTFKHLITHLRNYPVLPIIGDSQELSLFVQELEFWGFEESKTSLEIIQKKGELKELLKHQPKFEIMNKSA